MTPATLRARARKGTLEVEHILAAAKERVPALRETLERLAKEEAWSDTPYPPDGTHVVPLAKWSEVACAYAENGIDGLRPLAELPSNLGYIAGLLEELKTAVAVDALIEFFAQVMKAPGHNLEMARRLATALNLLLSVKGAVIANESQASTIRPFLISFYSLAESAPHKAWALYALRGVGNEDTLVFLLGINDLPAPYDKTRKEVIKAIRKRIAP